MFIDHRHKIEPLFPGCCFDAESHISHAAGHCGRNRRMGEFLMGVAVDLRWLDALLPEQKIQAQPGA